MQSNNELLLSHAQKLYETGLAIEQELHLLINLSEQGVDYNNPDVLQALERFKQAYAEWQQLKIEYQLLNKF